MWNLWRQAPEVVLDPSGSLVTARVEGDGVSEAKPKARRERWSMTPSALSRCLALEVLRPEPGDGVSTTQFLLLVLLVGLVPMVQG